MDFSEKHIVVGVAGGIAAYKACDLIRELYRRQARRVTVIMTPTAEAFIPALTLEALSREKVHTSELALDEHGVPLHIALAQNADALLIIPATSNLMAKMAVGLADDLLTTTAITFTGKPVVIAPAMNTRMWDHPLTKKNRETLEALDNVTLTPPTRGELACGEVGEGHLASLEMILLTLYRQIHNHKRLYHGLHALVTAGGTQEPIDPVRVITNRSSGLMGQALADELYAMGAEVTLVSTNPHLERPYPVVYVERADEMRIAVENRFANTDLLLMAAAVSDYTVANPAKEKLKRKDKKPLVLELTPNRDILAGLGKVKKSTQLLVGFAAESQFLFQNAREKLERKNLDLIIANDISQDDIGFNATHNEVTLIFKDKEQLALPRGTKQKVAQDILVQIHKRLLSRKRRTKSADGSSTIKH